MAHTAQPAGPPHRTREIIIGVSAIVIAIPVIIVLILALRHPNGRRAVDAATGAGSSSSAGAVAPTSAASSPSGASSTAGAATTSPAPAQTSISTTPTTPATPTSAATSSSVVKLPVIVLNNTAAAGSTALAVSRFEAAGWTATDGGTFEGAILSTAAYYDPNADGSKAAALALQQQFPAIRRVVPAFTGLPNGPVIVVLTSDYH